MSALPEAARTPDGYRVRRLEPGFEVWRGRTLLYRAGGWSEGDDGVDGMVAPDSGMGRGSWR